MNVDNKIISNTESYFPIQILLLRTGERKVIENVNKIPPGEAFRILQTKVDVHV